MGLDVPRPRLSWRLAARPAEKNIVQQGYQVLAAASRETLDQDQGDLWDSGRVETDQQTLVPYGGKKPKPRQRIYWKVRCWVAGEAPTAWSEPANWEMGLTNPADWKAHWISQSDPGDPTVAGPSPCLRKPFEIPGTIRRARLYISALGIYEAWINGQRVGQNLFTPGWTDYNIRIPYQTYDVTHLLSSGENMIGAILGDGWYCGTLGWGEKGRNQYGPHTALIAQLEIDLESGRRMVVASDSSWRCATGPILSSEFYMGETYDANGELDGWTNAGAGFDDSIWAPTALREAPAAPLVWSPDLRVRTQEELRPISMKEIEPGRWIFDLGQNMVGFVRLRITGQAGEQITLRFAEVLKADGHLYAEALRRAKSIDRYTLRSANEEVWEPRFTFHGFRFVELSGASRPPTPETITGIVTHSAIPPAGEFECSDPLLNQLQHNILWGQKGNFLEVPTDCPQRDERLGWTGDAQAFIRTACFNRDVAAFFTKWIQDLADSQSPRGCFPSVVPDVLNKRDGDGGPAWADAGIICPWTIYLCYGDRGILARHYGSMQKYIEYLCRTDINTRHAYYDWLNVDDPTPKELICSAFNIYSTSLMSKIAEVLGKQGDSARYARLVKQMKKDFCHEFLTKTGRLVGASQTAYVLALHFDVLPEDLRPLAVQRLVQQIHDRNDHLSTGFVGTPYLMHVLSRFGHSELAWKLLLNKTYPSWGYPITQGATTMWERWNGYHHEKGFADASMNSFNHYAYGAVGDWMYQVIGGIDLDENEPGYRHIVIHPRPGGGLTWAKASLRTPLGTVTTDWQVEGQRMTLTVEVPPGAHATVRHDGVADVKIGSGRYEFAWPAS